MSVDDFSSPDSTKLGFIDTHNHLCDSAFLDDVDEVVHRAMASGVQAAIVLTETIPDISRALELREKYPDWVNLGFGIHPVQKRNDGSNLPRSVVTKDMDGFRELLQKYSDLLVAVGEVGLDFTPSICATPDSHEIQRHVLSTQIRLANRFNLPLNVHSRSASKPTIELLRSEGATRVQMHAFDGRPSQALIGVSAGYYFSVPPCVLRSKQKQELVKAVPLTNLLLETDAPVLGVSAEVRNEPASVVRACEYIAEAKGLDVATVRQITSENAQKLYPSLKLKRWM